MRHECIGEGCLRCQHAIDEREFGPTWDEGDTDAAERQYERQLDRMGEGS
jgi:hypothetical protein